MTNPQRSFHDPLQPREDQDDEILRQLGLRHELRREFTKFSTLSFATGILGCAASIASTANTPVLLGGPATTIWAWLLGSIGCLAIAASVAELVSAYPTAGGVYTSTAFVIPSAYRRSVTFVTGWLTFIGQLATPASVIFALAQMIFAAITISSDGVFIASTSQTLGLYIGLNVLIGVFNSMPTLFLHRISNVYVFANLIATFAVIIGIPLGGRGHLAPSSFVWGSIVNQSGWNSHGFAFFLGLFSVQWVMTDYDASAHIAEEIKNAAIATPVAIVVGVALTAILGFFVNVALCYGIHDLSTLPGPSGLVFSQILWDNLGKAGGLFVWSLIIVVQTITGATCQLAAIRSVYAVSRDNALPDNKLLSRVSKVTQTPVNAVVFVVFVSALFGLLYLASFVAINAVFRPQFNKMNSITAVALDLSYMIPIVAKICIHWQSKVDVKFKPGPFYMGKFGYLVNLYAVVWTVIETGILIMPQVAPVNGNTMNYTGPIIGAVCGLSWIWYKLYWHQNYLGPAVNIVVSLEESQETRVERKPDSLDAKEPKK